MAKVATIGFVFMRYLNEKKSGSNMSLLTRLLVSSEDELKVK